MSLFDGYDTGKFYDEMFQSKDIPRSSCKNVFEQLNNLSPDQFKNRCDLAEMTLVNQGITFTVYGDNAAEEKPFPVDLIPRVIPADEWKYIVAGLTQRVRALNLFLYLLFN